MCKKKMTSKKELNDIPYIIIIKILQNYELEVSSEEYYYPSPAYVSIKYINLYGYFKRDKNRKIYGLFPSIKIIEPKIDKIRKYIPKEVTSLFIKRNEEIKQKHLVDMLKYSNIIYLTMISNPKLNFYSEYLRPVNISDFSIFSNLESLIIKYKPITFTSKVSVCNHLKYLYFRGKEEKLNISQFIKNFPNLKRLTLQSIRIKDVELLSTLKQLEVLQFVGCEINTTKHNNWCTFYDFKPKIIFISGIYSDEFEIEFLYKNEKLKVFIYDQTPITLTGINLCNNIERLIVNELENPEIFKYLELPKLNYLSLEKLSSDLPRLYGLQSLTLLNLERSNVSKIGMLNDLKNLLVLNLEKTKIISLNELDISTLLYINISKTKITSLNPLSRSRGLLAVEAANTKLVKIDVILPNIIVFNVNYCKLLKDISEIYNFKKIEYLGIQEVTADFNIRKMNLLNIKRIFVTDIKIFKDFSFVTDDETDFQFYVKSLKQLKDIFRRPSYYKHLKYWDYFEENKGYF